MSRYCLDTVSYSHFKRGEQRITTLLDRAEWIGVPVIVIGELCAGFAKGSKRQKNLDELDEFLALPVVETMPVDRLIAETFGDLMAELRRKGRPIPVNDVWIAATCARAGATLLINSGFHQRDSALQYIFRISLHLPKRVAAPCDSSLIV